MLPPVSRPCEEWSRKIFIVPQYSNVSVNIVMYTLFNNIVMILFTLLLYVWTFSAHI